MRKSKFINFIAILTVAFIVLPLLIIIVTSFGADKAIKFPIEGFTLNWYLSVFKNATFMSSLKVSLILGIVSAFLGVALALPTAYGLTKRRGKVSNFLLSFFLSPNLIPGIVLGIMLYRIMVIGFHMNLTAALVIGHMLITLPYSIRVLASGLNEFDESVEEAAISLGATKFQAFYMTVLPYLKSSIITSFMMSFINSFNNLPVSMYLKSPGINTLPSALMNYIEYNLDPSVSALSVILMVFTFVMMRLMDKALGVKKLT